MASPPVTSIKLKTLALKGLHLGVAIIVEGSGWKKGDKGITGLI
ncbi:hypothetical protein [Psychrobacter sp. AH5]